MSTIADVMRAPAVTVGPDAPLSHVVALMVDHGVSELPVVNSSDELIGIIGEADVYRARLTDEQTHFGSADADHPYDGRVVSDLMRRPVITVRDTDSLMLCQLRLMGLARSLPVLQAGTVVGLVDRKRLLSVYAEWDAADGEVSPGSLDRIDPNASNSERLADPEMPVLDPPAVAASPQISVEMVMSRPVISVTQEQTLAEVWGLMSSRGIRHVAITADGHCVGVIDDRQVAALWPQGPAAMQTSLASHFLGRRVACVLPGASLSEAAAILKDDGVGAVPVIDDHGTLLGLLTAVDVVQAVARWGINPAVISQPMPRRDLTPSGHPDPTSSSASYQRPGTPALSANAAFILAAERAT